MQYYRWLLMAVLAFSANAYAFQSKVEIIEQFDNLRMVAFIGREDINNSPEWEPNSGGPPLSVEEAIQAVKTFIKDPTGTLPIREIEIRTVPRHEKHWHYLVKIKNDAMKTKYDIYVVLMNGKVIPAIIEPQAYK